MRRGTAHDFWLGPMRLQDGKMLLEKTNELHSGCTVSLIVKTETAMLREPVRRSPRSWQDRIIRSDLIVGSLSERGRLGSFDSLDSCISCVVLG